MGPLFLLFCNDCKEDIFDSEDWTLTVLTLYTIMEEFVNEEVLPYYLRVRAQLYLKLQNYFTYGFLFLFFLRLFLNCLLFIACKRSTYVL